eukprot:CAMPEP_0177350732 /NCGR_PEP_ID=MMETSP0368-20130122/31479_1 /TAXON_ID=447022 ORGANISM="Scrippsiella hangoei-like, Strain SHHI-4" /NCGR_SAMPLE_ID=MMETSP0368 /ASSEMBLY_ACC=CAM_ASM_000363 /LENGTH=184 /DNA_ID=CAMNT_0018812677 /DNA_START=104 /DNA_END=658 /DNA_ORIENTATION=+
MKRPILSKLVSSPRIVPALVERMVIQSLPLRHHLHPQRPSECPSSEEVAVVCQRWKRGAPTATELALPPGVQVGQVVLHATEALLQFLKGVCRDGVLQELHLLVLEVGHYLADLHQLLQKVVLDLLLHYTLNSDGLRCRGRLVDGQRQRLGLGRSRRSSGGGHADEARGAVRRRAAEAPKGKEF